MLLLLAVAGCDEGGEGELHPGPCESSYLGPETRTEDRFCEYDYDADGRLIATESRFEGIETLSWTTSFEYRDGVMVGAVATRTLTGEACSRDTWTIDDDAVVQVREFFDSVECQDEISTTTTYQVDQFRFDEIFHCQELVAPSSVLERREDIEGGVTSTFTYDGPPRQGTRTRTETRDGSVVGTRVFSYDAAGRLVRDESDTQLDVRQIETFVYDAQGRLRTSATQYTSEGSVPSEITYTYDAAGNLLRSEYVRDGGTLELERGYDDACW